MHSRAVPVGIFAERFAVPINVHAIFFAKTGEKIAGDPHLVGSALGAFAENLEFPLAFGDFGVDAFVIDSGFKAEIEMFFNNLASDVSDVFVANTRVVFALRRRETASSGKAQRNTVFVEEVFLLESEPRVGIIGNCRA